MKARTPTRGTHPFPSKSISSPSIPDIPSLKPLKQRRLTMASLLPLDNVFFPRESTDPAGQKVPFLEQNIEKTKRPGCSAVNKHTQSWTACFIYGILESFPLA